MPVGPCKESTKGFLGLMSFINPDTAFRMKGDAICCPISLLSRSALRPTQYPAKNEQDSLKLTEQELNTLESWVHADETHMMGCDNFK